jgi:hypothetical protein
MDMVREKVTICWLKGLLDQSGQGLVINEDEEQGDYEEIKT